MTEVLICSCQEFKRFFYYVLMILDYEHNFTSTINCMSVCPYVCSNARPCVRPSVRLSDYVCFVGSERHSGGRLELWGGGEEAAGGTMEDSRRQVGSRGQRSCFNVWYMFGYRIDIILEMTSEAPTNAGRHVTG